MDIFKYFYMTTVTADSIEIRTYYPILTFYP